MTDYHLAQFNIATLHQPLDHEGTTEFVEALAPINELAEGAPGFVWRLTDDDGASSSFVAVPGIDDDLTIVNYSIWEDLESLKDFMYRSHHVDYMRRRREWFRPTSEATTVAWWVGAGVIPEVAEAHRRLEQLRRDGPSPEAFPLTHPYPPPT